MHASASCTEIIEVSNKKNLIFTFTNRINHPFPKKYEYCIKISNKSSAIFMNNAIATVSVVSESSKTNLRLDKKSLGYFFLPSEQNNTINFKIRQSSSFSVSFVSFPDECDAHIVSNEPEQLISTINYSHHSINFTKKTKAHICYFSGFPFESQFKYNDDLAKKYSLKFTSNQNISFEQYLEYDSNNSSSKPQKINIAKFLSPTLIEWDISAEDYNNFQIKMNENNESYTINNDIDRNFNRRTKIHQILSQNNRIITGDISYSFNKTLLAIIISIFAGSFLLIIIILIIILHRKGVCCVKTVNPIEQDSNDWEVCLDQNENELVYRKPYPIENVDSPYSSDKEILNKMKRGTASLNPSSLLNFQDSLTTELLPNSA